MVYLRNLHYSFLIRSIGSAKQLQYYFASLHLLPDLPQLVIIDDFSSFFGPLDKAEILKTLAFIKEAAHYASEAM